MSELAFVCECVYEFIAVVGFSSSFHLLAIWHAIHTYFHIHLYTLYPCSMFMVLYGSLRFVRDDVQHTWAASAWNRSAVWRSPSGRTVCSSFWWDPAWIPLLSPSSTHTPGSIYTASLLSCKGIRAYSCTLYNCTCTCVCVCNLGHTTVWWILLLFPFLCYIEISLCNFMHNYTLTLCVHDPELVCTTLYCRWRVCQ